MVGTRLEAGSQPQYFIIVLRAKGNKIGNARLAFGQSTGFVKRNGPYPADGFQGTATLDEQPPTGASRQPSRNRRRCGKNQCTRTRSEERRRGGTARRRMR